MLVMGCGVIGWRDLKSDLIGERWHVVPVSRINGDSSKESTEARLVE